MPAPRTHAVLEQLRSTSFERLHLKRNPFGELPRAERAAAACVDTEAVAAYLSEAPAKERRVLQLLGDHGRGKSTLLLTLHARSFSETPYTQLQTGSPVPRATADAQLYFVDSIENLGWLGRHRLYGRCPSLACTTHRDLTPELRRAGYRVRTHRVGIRSAQELRPMVNARVQAAALPTGSPPFPTDDLLQTLFEEHYDDVRGTEAALYHEYERLRSAAPAGPRAASLTRPIPGSPLATLASHV